MPPPLPALQALGIGRRNAHSNGRAALPVLAAARDLLRALPLIGQINHIRHAPPCFLHDAEPGVSVIAASLRPVGSSGARWRQSKRRELGRVSRGGTPFVVVSGAKA